MKTVDKAISIINQFSAEHVEIGLNEMSRMTGIDKAATRRLLVALTKHGLIEQTHETRKYRLGHGFLRFARIREETVPISRSAREVTDWLVEQANETVHVSIPGQTGMTTIAYRLPQRRTVVTIIASQILFYHATASGLAFLAFASPESANEILALDREKVTEATVTSEQDIRKLMATFKKQGYAHTIGTFADDVSSIAMPFFADTKDPAGAIALALPGADLTDARIRELLPILKTGISRMEKSLTGC